LNKQVTNDGARNRPYRALPLIEYLTTGPSSFTIPKRQYIAVHRGNRHKLHTLGDRPLEPISQKTVPLVISLLPICSRTEGDIFRARPCKFATGTCLKNWLIFFKTCHSFATMSV